jgi:ribosomal protein S18 acetylase RimI-like enzyme
MNDDLGYRLLTLADVEEAAQVISRAFEHDPLIEFMLPFKSTRIRTLLKFFRPYGEINIQHGRGYGVGRPLQGVAYWEFPEQGSISVSLRSLGRFLPLLFTMYPIGYFRARAVIEMTGAMHTKYASGPHYYLDNLGVLPSAQGKGYSSKLLRPILEQADVQGIMAYTDTVSPANVPFYEHFGFQCVEASTIPGTGITIFALRRPAQ